MMKNFLPFYHLYKFIHKKEPEFGPAYYFLWGMILSVTFVTFLAAYFSYQKITKGISEFENGFQSEIIYDREKTREASE